MARSYLRKENVKQWVPSTQSRIELSRNYHNEKLQCKLTVTHTNATAAFKSEGIANLINSIQIVANGNKTIKHIDVKKLMYNQLMHMGRHNVLNTLVTTDGAAKVSTLYFTIDFNMRGMGRPADTIENTALYTTFDMLIDWAASANLGTGITVTAADITVASKQLVNYSRNAGERIAHNVEVQLVKEVTSSTAEFQIELPTQTIYSKFLIAAFVDGVRNSAVINSVKLKSGTTIFAEWDADMLRAMNIDNNAIETASDVVGLVQLDLVGRGKLSDALDTRGEFNTLELVLNVTKQSGTNNVVVYSDIFDVENAVEVKG